MSVKFFKNNESGFTLMELIVVLGVFTISTLMITEIFMIFNRSQRKILERQRLQNDINYTVEMMARSIRLGSINYVNYAGAIGNPEERLYLNDASGRKVSFEKASDQSEGCVDAQSSPCIIA
ncbi:MAG: type II secretion system protein [bacterium]